MAFNGIGSNFQEERTAQFKDMDFSGFYGELSFIAS